jgi:hypothetical protein
MEAAYLLAGPIKAGTWHIIGDGIVLDPVDVTFDVLWRDANGDHPIATWTNHFDPPANVNNAAQAEADVPGVAANAKGNDQLVLRMTAQGAGTADTMLWAPNGDAEKTNGRDPSLTLPK